MKKSAISAKENAIINIVFCGILPKNEKNESIFFQNEANNAKFKHFQIHNTLWNEGVPHAHGSKTIFTFLSTIFCGKLKKFDICVSILG